MLEYKTIRKRARDKTHAVAYLLINTLSLHVNGDLLQKSYPHCTISRGKHLHYDGDDFLLVFFRGQILSHLRSNIAENVNNVLICILR